MVSATSLFFCVRLSTLFFVSMECVYSGLNYFYSRTVARAIQYFVNDRLCCVRSGVVDVAVVLVVLAVSCCCGCCLWLDRSGSDESVTSL